MALSVDWEAGFLQTSSIAQALPGNVSMEPGLSSIALYGACTTATVRVAMSSIKLLRTTSVSKPK